MTARPTKRFPAFWLVLLAGATWFFAGSGGAAAGPLGPVELRFPASQLQLAESFFERLFGSPQRARPRRETRPRAAPRRDYRQRERRSRRSSSSAARSEPQAQPKNEDAKQVVVIGDAFAYGLARALERIYAEAPGIEVHDESKPNSGIVRDDYYDWRTEVKRLLEERKVDVAVMMIGSNDRQQMRLPGGRVSVRSEAYEKNYIERIDAILQTFAEKQVPVFWVGLPVMRSQSYGEDMAYLNEIFKARTSRFGAVFVDIWDRFADEEGRYNASGPDVAGRNRKLRTDRGIYMTKTGYEKIAYFLDKDMQSVLYFGVPSGPALSLQQGPGLPQLPRGPIEMEVSLTSPQTPEVENELADARPEPEKPATPDDPPPTYKVLVLGKSLEPKEGRADDFSWPRPEPADDTEKAPGAKKDESASSEPAKVPLPPQRSGGS